MNKPLISVSVEVVVPFHDLDPMEVAWHGHYVKYFELARCALLDRIDYNYPQMRASGYAWPVIDLHVRYAQPARFNQRLTVRAGLVEWEQRLKIQYQIHAVESGQRLTKGHTVQVAVQVDTGEMCFVSPAILFEKLGVKPE
jgi:acyl-CoA thioester hydrolase